MELIKVFSQELCDEARAWVLSDCNRRLAQIKEPGRPPFTHEEIIGNPGIRITLMYSERVEAYLAGTLARPKAPTAPEPGEGE